MTGTQSRYIQVIGTYTSQLKVHTVATETILFPYFENDSGSLFLLFRIDHVFISLASSAHSRYKRIYLFCCFIFFFFFIYPPPPIAKQKRLMSKTLKAGAFAFCLLLRFSPFGFNKVTFLSKYWHRISLWFESTSLTANSWNLVRSLESVSLVVFWRRFRYSKQFFIRNIPED